MNFFHIRVHAHRPLDRYPATRPKANNRHIFLPQLPASQSSSRPDPSQGKTDSGMHRSSRPFRSTRVTKPFAVLHSPPKMRQSLSASVVFPLIMTVVIMGMFGHVPVVSGDPVQDDPARTSLGNTQESFGGMSVKSVDMVPGDVELHGSIMCEIPKVRAHA